MLDTVVLRVNIWKWVKQHVHHVLRALTVQTRAFIRSALLQTKEGKHVQPMQTATHNFPPRDLRVVMPVQQK